MFLILLDDVLARYAFPSAVVEIVDNRMASSLVHEVTPKPLQSVEYHLAISASI